MKKRNIVSLIFCIVFCYILGVSSIFIVKNIDHDCSIVHCAICTQIHRCEVILNNNFNDNNSDKLISIFIATVFIGLIWHHIDYFSNKTLITLKVKLSD